MIRFTAHLRLACWPLSRSAQRRFRPFRSAASLTLPYGYTTAAMADRSRVSAATLVELAGQLGLALDLERAEAIRPNLESLLGRLSQFPELLPRAATPPPTPAAR